MSDDDLAAARERLALAQHALLSALVAGSPPPEGFDRRGLAAQRRALLTKRAHVIAKVAPELREILGADFPRLFRAYAQGRPMAEGYRRDAADFAHHVLATTRDAERRQRLTVWAARQSDSTPEKHGLLGRVMSALKKKGS
ncbi:hypothetical protein FHS39_002491 [Streptomyces olivoverticillatus]|uniref:SCO6045-like C-terminal domain-containing protein n=1 Tax=Streptomyces olivoverticillatus TaxID=66427 RepID=A0A7W7LNF7_9ACTN|nr:hypothetical protein [Streptomyces olivoverticillatus]